MLFSSVTFLFVFLPVILFIYYVMPRKIRNYVLLVGSLLFYAWGEPKYIFVMLGSIIIGYVAGLVIDIFLKKEMNKQAKATMLISVGLCILIFLFFKYLTEYYNLIVTKINLKNNTDYKILQLVLPLGISFYTFQILSYIVDVYRKEVKVQKNIINLATYITFFPQLIAGPIVRYNTVWNELENRRESIDDFGEGVRRFLIGLGKKILIANAVGELFDNINNLGNDEKTVVLYWVASVAFSLQIYFDFSGYSDMAIGLGRMFGFHFMENFDYPYISKNITEFWRRWHISLSTWFKDYVYIPLGGNRRGNGKTIRNMFIVWSLTGFWHGAQANFVIWGIYYFVLLMLEKNVWGKILQRMPKIIASIYSLFFINLGWVIFSNEKFYNLKSSLKGMFGFGKTPFCSNLTIYYLLSYGIILVVAFLLATPLMKKILQKLKWLEFVGLFLILVLSTAYLAAEGFNPFLYFRF